jgi:hypothetical protein
MKGGTWLYNKYGHVEITWPDGKSIYMQVDTEVSHFFDMIGLDLEDMSPGDMDTLPEWADDEYYEVAD